MITLQGRQLGCVSRQTATCMDPRNRPNYTMPFHKTGARDWSLDDSFLAVSGGCFSFLGVKYAIAWRYSVSEDGNNAIPVGGCGVVWLLPCPLACMNQIRVGSRSNIQ